eukprot:744196-Rhodomonas_salina.1
MPRNVQPCCFCPGLTREMPLPGKMGLGPMQMVQNLQTLTVKKFQNRLLGLPIETQNQVFLTFYEQKVHLAKSQQKLSDGILVPYPTLAPSSLAPPSA